MRLRGSDRSSDSVDLVRQSTRRSSQAGIIEAASVDQTARRVGSSADSLSHGSGQSNGSRRSSPDTRESNSDADDDQDNTKSAKLRCTSGVERDVIQDIVDDDGHVSDLHTSTSAVIHENNDLLAPENLHAEEHDDLLEDDFDDPKDELSVVPTVQAPVAVLGKRKRKKTKACKGPKVPNMPRESTPRVVIENAQIHTSGGSPSPDKSVTGGALKRLPGRRRAPHADVQVEAKLRRQLELKVAYRAVAKAQKLILAELARRTAEELEANTEAHKDYDEYEDVTEELEVRLLQRLQMLQASFDQEEARMKRMLAAQEHILKEKFIQIAIDSQDDRLLQAQYELLTMLRSVATEDDSEATEDEDGLIPPLYTVRAPDYERTPLSSAYESRSRVFVRTQELWDNLETRFEVREAQRVFDPASLVAKPRGFATFDWALRDRATAAWNVDMLIDAVFEVDEETVETELAEKYDAAAVLQAFAAQPTTVLPKLETPKQLFKREQSPHAKETSIDHVQSNYVHTPVNGITPSSEPPAANILETQVGDTRMLGGRPLFTQITPQAIELSMSVPENRAVPPEIIGEPPTTLVSTPSDGFWTGPSPQLNFEERQLPGPSEQARIVEQPRELPPPLDFLQANISGPPMAPAAAIDYVQTVNNALAKTRTRPGPKAVYAPPGGYGVPPTQQKHWSPFTNSMGPPMYSVPKYMQSGDTHRRPSIPNNGAELPSQPLEANALQPPFALHSFDYNGSLHNEQRKSSNGTLSEYQSVVPARPQDAYMGRHPSVPQPPPQQLQQPQQLFHAFQPGPILPPQDIHRRESDPFRPQLFQPMHPPSFFQQQGPPQPPVYQYQPFSPFQHFQAPQLQAYQHQPPPLQQNQANGLPHFSGQGQGHAGLMLPQFRANHNDYPRPLSPPAFPPHQPHNDVFAAPQQQSHRNSFSSVGSNGGHHHTYMHPANHDVNRRDRGSPADASQPRNGSLPLLLPQQQTSHIHNNGHPAYAPPPFTPFPPLQPPPAQQAQAPPQQRTQRAFSSSKPSVASLLQTPQPATSSGSQAPGVNSAGAAGQRPASRQEQDSTARVVDRRSEMT